MRNILLVLLISILFLSSCNSGKDNKNLYVYDAVDVLFSPLTIEPYENLIYISDYFYDFTIIDSVSYQYPQYLVSVEGNEILLDISYYQINYLSELIFWVGDHPYSLLLKKQRLVRAGITFEPGIDTHYNNVQIAGEWNDWNPEEWDLDFKGYSWSTIFYLEPGEYQFQMVADGKWMTNTKYRDSIPNGFGQYNSIKKIVWKGDPVPEITAKSFTAEEIVIKSTGTINEYIFLWQNKRIPIDLSLLSGYEYSLPIPQEAFQTDISYIRAYGVTKDGITNDLLIPLKNGKVITNTIDLTRNQKHLQIMYFALVDRFFNGNKDNDMPVQNNEVAFRANYQGGDIEGISQKLEEDYFDKLGINTLWLSPVMQNPEEAYREYPEPKRMYSGYHGYWPISSTEIDHRLGDKSSLKHLVDMAHSMDKNIVLDFVANHVHELHPLYQEHPEWATDLILEDGTMNIRIWEDQRLTTWFDTFLPSWDFSIPEVRETIADYALTWLTEYDIDGFRHDATKHIPESFWRLLTNKIKANGKSIYQIGETFGSRKLIGSYVTTGMLDGQFDFNLYFDSRFAFASDSSSMEPLGKSLTASLGAYGHHHLMGNITGNHDLPRFTSLASGDLKFDEDEKEAGWDRDIEITNPIGYKKMELLMSFLFTVPGVPCIYYGDEIGMAGASDPDNRRMMIFDKLNKNQEEVLNTCSKLANLRSSSMALLYGETKVTDSRKLFIAIQRKYFDEIVIVLINKAPYRQRINTTFRNLPKGLQFETLNNTEFKYETFDLSLELPPYSYEILISKKP